MKMKKAIKKAKKLEYTWVAVDSAVYGSGDKIIMAYNQRPIRNTRFWMPGIAGTGAKYIGKYTGKKPWYKTATKVV